MPFVVGIDEAGYGPLLGPLVVGGTLWRVDAQHARGDFWKLLGKCVARSVGKGHARLAVGDSKQIYDRKQGIAALERTILAFARALEMSCGTVAELLAALGAQTAASALCPWYGDLSPTLPRDPARSECTGAALRLGATMAAAGVACCGLRIELLREDEFNRRMAVVHNKHTLVVESVLRLMHWAGTGAAQAGDCDLHVYVDRLGGRVDYRELLMLAFPERSLHVLEVGEGCSRYRLATAGSDWFVEFRVEGDSRHLPIALASMLAKYVRELLMERFNAFWCGLAPELRPTAGYYGDARRFMTEIEPLLARTGLPAAGFVRTC
jgi:hypothetical protein